MVAAVWFPAHQRITATGHCSPMHGGGRVVPCSPAHHSHRSVQSHSCGRVFPRPPAHIEGAECILLRYTYEPESDLIILFEIKLGFLT